MKKSIILLLSLSIIGIVNCQTNENIQQIVDKTIDNKFVYGTVVSILKDDTLNSYYAGNITDTTQYFIASTTKLYTTAVILKLRYEAKLSLHDKISKYLSSEVMKNLHTVSGIDYTDSITIKHLMGQTSGLPDYFEGKPNDSKSLYSQITEQGDRFWTFEEAIERSKNMSPKFKPQNDKAYYSDTNFQLLQKIIKQITNKSIELVYQEYIFNPLDLKETYLYLDHTDIRPIQLYYKKDPLIIPKAMTSFKADGGIVSTSLESITFVRAFFTGILFPKEYIDELKHWNSIMFPLEYGVGLMRYKLPSYMAGGKSIELHGHSGLSGAFSFYDPERDIYISGSVNQISKPATSFQLIAKVLSKL